MPWLTLSLLELSVWDAEVALPEYRATGGGGTGKDRVGGGAGATGAETLVEDKASAARTRDPDVTEEAAVSALLR